MGKIIGVIVILVGFGLAYAMDFSLISDIIAIAALIIGGKIPASD